MQNEYTDDQTARVREFERSSAGHQTQPLVLPSQPAQSSSRIIGIVLLVLGFVLLPIAVWSQLGGGVPFDIPDRGEIQAGLILLTIGSCFLFFAFWRRIYPFFIPGCVLAGLSFGVTFASLSHGASVLWGLSLGFLSLFLLGRVLFPQSRYQNWWPIIPSVVLFGVGTIIAIANLPSLFLIGAMLLPVLLIAAGVVLGTSRRP